MNLRVLLPLLAFVACREERLVPALTVDEFGTASIVPDLTCANGTFTLSRTTPTVMLVLDRSRSMVSPFGTTGESRWKNLTNAMATALPSVTPSLPVGALLFPSSSAADSCSVPGSADVAPALGTANEILSRMKASQPAGQTPTAEALVAAAQVVDTSVSAARARALVLATDGAPDCNAALSPATCTCSSPGTACSSATVCLDDTRTVRTLEALAASGLPTWVVGLQDASNPTLLDVLSKLAVAGGRPRLDRQHFFSATSAQTLSQAFEAIELELTQCTRLVDSVPGVAGAITVTVNGVVVPFDASGQGGWRWGDERRGEIVFRGAACTQLQQQPEAAVSAVVTCGE